MSDTVHTTEPAVTANSSHAVLARAFTALRIFTGLVWLTNALAKVFNTGRGGTFDPGRVGRWTHVWLSGWA